ncbi:hypothetical protein QL285_090546 [Trifolium repens]|nr:hypothetical protein QL285_090546 [Trifolium repens]
MLGECQTILFRVIMQVVSPDRWQWRSNPVTGYSVHEAYQILTSTDAITLRAADDLIWHKQVPLKVSILVWRLFRDRLPTKTVTARALFYVYSRPPRRCTSRSSPPPSLVEFLPSVGIEPYTMGISTCSIHSHYQFVPS